MSVTAPSCTGLEPDSYRPHLLHGPGRSYPESNCYTDVLIELVHARGHEPLAMFAHLVRMDFEGDQWTFFKPPPEDLELLFAIDIHEMQPYRPLPQQIVAALEAGRTIIVELDSFYLPDTAATSYRSGHVKSSVAAEAIDPDGLWLRYFHGAGLYELSGEDYLGCFRLGREFSDDVLPPYTELVRFDAGAPLDGQELREVSSSLLCRHLEHRPSDNPFERFGAHLARALPSLLEEDMDAYHAYAFATVRMAGAAFEIAATYVDWLLGDRGDPAAAAFGEIVDGCKALGFRLARRRSFEIEPRIERLAAAWSRAIDALATAAG